MVKAMDPETHARLESRMADLEECVRRALRLPGLSDRQRQDIVAPLLNRPEPLAPIEALRAFAEGAAGKANSRNTLPI